MTPCGIFVPKNIKAAREYFLAAFLCLFVGYVLQIWKNNKNDSVADITRRCIVMTLNILFLSITIKKHEVNLEKAGHNEMVEKLYEQNRDRQISKYHII
jgi:uncharacterized protein (TIGR02413 family)